MPTESEVKSRMVKLIRKAGGYGRRIEDQYGVGILDTILIPLGGPTFFCEVKIIRANLFGPTDRQWIEMGRINATAAPYCYPILVGFQYGDFYFHEFGPKQVDKRACFSVTTSDMPFPQQLNQFYNARLK